MVIFNKPKLLMVCNELVNFICIGLWDLKAVSYDVKSSVVVICELYSNGITFRSVNHPVSILSFLFIIHLKYT